MGELSVEYKHFKQALPKLLSEHEGKYVLIHKDEIVGVFDSEMDAVNEGYEKIGIVSFLVKEILEKERIYAVGYTGVI